MCRSKDRNKQLASAAGSNLTTNSTADDLRCRLENLDKHYFACKSRETMDSCRKKYLAVLDIIQYKRDEGIAPEAYDGLALLANNRLACLESDIGMDEQAKLRLQLMAKAPFTDFHLMLRYVVTFHKGSRAAARTSKAFINDLKKFDTSSFLHHPLAQGEPPTYIEYTIRSLLNAAQRLNREFFFGNGCIALFDIAADLAEMRNLTCQSKEIKSLRETACSEFDDSQSNPGGPGKQKAKRGAAEKVAKVADKAKEEKAEKAAAEKSAAEKAAKAAAEAALIAKAAAEAAEVEAALRAEQVEGKAGALVATSPWTIKTNRKKGQKMEAARAEAPKEVKPWTTNGETREAAKVARAREGEDVVANVVNMKAAGLKVPAWKMMLLNKDTGPPVDEDSCVVCLDAKREFLPACGHLCVCEACSKKVKQCPVCRQDAPNWIKLINP